MTNERICVWDLSLLGWTDGGASPQIDGPSSPAVPPNVVISDPWNSKTLYRIKFSQVPYPAVADNRVYFDVYYRTGDDSISRYQLDVHPHGSETSLSLTLNWATRFPGPHLSTSFDISYAQLCYMWDTVSLGKRSYAYTLHNNPSLPPMSGEDVGEEIAMASYVCLGTHIPRLFCALSGRMICTEGDHVKVVDYLL